MGDLLAILLIGTAVLGPFIVLLWLGSKVFRGFNLLERRDFLTDFSGVIVLVVFLLAWFILFWLAWVILSGPFLLVSCFALPMERIVIQDEVIYISWIGAAVLGTLILLLWLGSKVLKGLNPLARRDFLIGFFGIILLNALLYPLSLALRGDSTLPETRAIISLALPWVVNLALLIFFAFYRPWIVPGALALVGFLIVLVILSGAFFLVSCFSILFIGMIFGLAKTILEATFGLQG
ncbi:MAG: hypothetical protein OEW09_06815 [Anaerolineae bacterium]|nr:hypothetical protein [Anaerolineae bacterium]